RLDNRGSPVLQELADRCVVPAHLACTEHTEKEGADRTSAKNLVSGMEVGPVLRIEWGHVRGSWLWVSVPAAFHAPPSFAYRGRSGRCGEDDRSNTLPLPQLD